MTRLLFATAIIAAAVVGGWYAFSTEGAITTFFSTDAPGATSVFRYINASQDDIFLISPQPGESVTTTIPLHGFARGPWYFEATFPVEVRDANGKVIGSSQAKAQSDWMTESFVPFTAELDLKVLYNGAATIVLKKDNPSGDPSKDATLSFPVMIQ